MRKFDLQTSFHRGNELIHAGVYRVPQDMAEDVASKAKADGLGEWIKEVKAVMAAPENKAAGGAAATPTFPAAGPGKRMEKDRRRGQRPVTHE